MCGARGMRGEGARRSFETSRECSEITRKLRSMTLAFEDVRAAMVWIAPYIHKTPVLWSEAFDVRAGAKLFFKCENFQKIGAFKARGASMRCFHSRRRKPGATLQSIRPEIMQPHSRTRRACEIL